MRSKAVSGQERFDRRFYVVVSYLLNIILAGYLLATYTIV